MKNNENDGGSRMLKRGIIFTAFIFVIVIISQWIFRPEINWIDVIGISIAIFLVYILSMWVENKGKKDYQ